jgi:hypothetical protein
LVELFRISEHYENQLPFEPSIKNILDLESLLKVNCKIETNQIIYFISIPINFENDFELYYLQSLPTVHESEFVTIIPNVKYFLKFNNEIKPLKDMCAKSRIYQCQNEFIDHNNPSCEEEILLHRNTSLCHYTKLNIKKSHIEVIPEINQYLGIFPSEEKITVK